MALIGVIAFVAGLAATPGTSGDVTVQADGDDRAPVRAVESRSPATTGSRSDAEPLRVDGRPGKTAGAEPVPANVDDPGDAGPARPGSATASSQPAAGGDTNPATADTGPAGADNGTAEADTGTTGDITPTTGPPTTSTTGVSTGPKDPAKRTAGSPQPGANFSEWNVPRSQQTRALDLLADAGMTWLRVDAGWRSFEENCDDCYSSSYIDRIDSLLANAEARGLDVLFTVGETPAWANSGDKLAPPDDPGEFEEFMAWLARRYRGRVIGYEIWNEPDIDMFFHGDVNDYVRVLQAGYRGVKAGDPGGTVVFAGTTHQNAAYIADAYAAGAGGYFDVMATHPYQGGSDKPPDHPTDGNNYWMTSQPTVTDVLRRNGDGHKEVWWTEFAWSVGPNHDGLPSYRRGVTEEQQGRYLVATLELAANRYPNVTRVAWYNTLERVDGGADAWTRGYALIRRDMTPRPALEALRRYTAGDRGS